MDRRYNPHCSDVSDFENSKYTKSDEELVLSATQVENMRPVVDKTYSTKRFAEPMTEPQLKSLSWTRLPANSIAKSNWALRTFTNWRLHRNSMRSKPCVTKFQLELLEMDNSTLNEAMGYFITEVKVKTDRRTKGILYMILLLLCNIIRGPMGGLKHRKLAKESVKAYQNKENPERCPVLLFEKYLNFRPSNCKNDLFTCNPESSTKEMIGRHLT
ncbi:hypothetical protein LOTGIDRAFT_157542 [Lottia gigantea]|uniref:ZMYM2-like/QRICH1 C-terminal domain-containing protein n=1 Tax=Lottia gigantea TaxID=225164 RepID=V4CH07_LOTGI|nr:hypothetical protein LOTGIDRAFT_157542 [Lottia gigantea]ESP01365.1 hypothetical protein LOTGIDRAFT_157542 [Lottia gigantea]